jgi:NAD(P)-dependent dehydrogenase (short-subunit alcohol dehydrogenase family)
MRIEAGQVAVVTGGAGGIGRALVDRFAAAGMRIVLADVEADVLDVAAAELAARDVEVLAVRTDVSKLADVEALAAATMERFGAVHVVCNNAGVAPVSDPWFGPLATWEWAVGVNLWGVLYGVRTFLPHLMASGGGHVVNTASIAGLLPGLGAPYDVSKHGVVAMTEDLYLDLHAVGAPVGVSVLCPGWVATRILDADRNWPDELGDRPEAGMQFAVVGDHLRRAIAEGLTPAAIADAVFDAVEQDRFWVLPQQDFLDLAINRWGMIAERVNPQAPERIPGLPTRTEMIEQAMQALAEGNGP